MNFRVIAILSCVVLDFRAAIRTSDIVVVRSAVHLREMPLPPNHTTRAVSLLCLRTPSTEIRRGGARGKIRA